MIETLTKFFRRASFLATALVIAGIVTRNNEMQAQTSPRNRLEFNTKTAIVQDYTSTDSHNYSLTNEISSIFHPAPKEQAISLEEQVEGIETRMNTLRAEDLRKSAEEGDYLEPQDLGPKSEVKTTPTPTIKPVITDKASKHSSNTRLNKAYGVDISLMRRAFGLQENARGDITIKNGKACGLYQFQPSRALEDIKQAKKEGYSIPYTGDLTKREVEKALRTSVEFNNFLINYNIERNARMFNGNSALIAAAHYSHPRVIERSVKLAYPGKRNFADVDLEDYAKRRPSLKQKTPDGISIYDYAKSVKGRYETLERKSR